MSDRIPFRVQPMLATLVPKAFHKPGWIYEEKYDGIRLLAYKEGTRVTLLSRNGKDRTAAFSVLAEAVRKLPARTLLIDGEAVVFDRRGISRFQLLQAGKTQPKYALFDCLYRDGRDLRQEPLTVRRAALEQVVGTVRRKTSDVFPSAILASNGIKAFESAAGAGYEGLVAKDESSTYVEGRSTKWMKVKAHREDEFIIVGFSAPAGSREHFGALLLGAYDHGQLIYVGKVGTGFTQKSLGALFQKLQRLVRARPGVINPPKEKNVQYVAPRLVAQISYEELTADRKLRQPVFLGLRDDKSASEITLPET